MKEKKRKWKEAGTVERFPPNFINGQKERSPYYSAPGAYILPQLKQNYKKNQNQKLLQGIKWEENKKRGTKVKNSNPSPIANNATFGWAESD